jgi:hypothetical protein
MFDNPPTNNFGLVGGSIARICQMIAAAGLLYIVAITSVDVIGGHYFVAREERPFQLNLS